MRVDTKPVKADITRTSGKLGKLVFQTNLNYLDLGDIDLLLKKNKIKKKGKTKKPSQEKHPKKKSQLAAKVTDS